MLGVRAGDALISRSGRWQRHCRHAITAGERFYPSLGTARRRSDPHVGLRRPADAAHLVPAPERGRRDRLEPGNGVRRLRNCDCRRGALIGPPGSHRAGSTPVVLRRSSSRPSTAAGDPTSTDRMRRAARRRLPGRAAEVAERVEGADPVTSSDLTGEGTATNGIAARAPPPHSAYASGASLIAPGRRDRCPDRAVGGAAPGSNAKSRCGRSSPCRCREAVGRLSVHVWGQSRRVSRERREDRGASGRERRWQRWYRAKTSSSSPSRKRARPAISAPVAVVCSERTWPRSVATIQLPRGCGTTRRQGDCIGPGPVLICVSASRVGVTTAVRAAAAREDQAKCCAYSLASKARAPLTSEQAIPPI